MKKYDILSKIKGNAIAIVRGDNADDVVNCCFALYEAGIKVMELPLTTPRLTFLLSSTVSTNTKKFGNSAPISFPRNAKSWKFPKVRSSAMLISPLQTPMVIAIFYALACVEKSKNTTAV